MGEPGGSPFKIQKEWEEYQKYLKSTELTEKYPPESIEENSSQIL